MEILSLTDNFCALPGCKAQHGLCLYIKTKNHKILFDLGRDGTFIKNACKLGVDIADIDTVIISHGHYDHGGGLTAFLKHNQKAKIFIRQSAFDKHYTAFGKLHIPIGLHDNNMNDYRIVFTSERFTIDNELELFSDVGSQEFISNANDGMLAKHGGEYTKDAFEHEQYLIVNDGITRILITGCSHKGIFNILEQYHRMHGADVIPLFSVIGGFHLYNPAKKEYASEEFIYRLSEKLDCFNVHYFTCHCTGKLAYLEMKKLLKDKLDYLAIGSCVQISDNGLQVKNLKKFSKKRLDKAEQTSDNPTNERTNERTNGIFSQPSGSSMKIAIIGCEKKRVAVLLKYLKKNRKDAVVRCFVPKDTEGIETFVKDDPYALIVFDTNNYSFFTAEKLSERHQGLNLIMISDSEQYAIDAFRLHVSDFWLYPYTAERVEEAFCNLRHTPEKR